MIVVRSFKYSVFKFVKELRRATLGIAGMRDFPYFPRLNPGGDFKRGGLGGGAGEAHR